MTYIIRKIFLRAIELRGFIKVFLTFLLLVLTLFKLAALQPDYDHSTEQILKVLETNTLLSNSLYEAATRTLSDEQRSDYLKDAEKNIRESSETLITLLGELRPLCLSSEGVAWTVTASGPAGKLIDYVGAKLNDRPGGCKAVQVNKGFFETLKAKSRDSYVVEILILFLGIIVLGIDVFDQYVYRRFPPMLKQGRRNPKPWYF